MDPNNVMEETGLNNKIFVSYDTVFANSQCLFVEYDDVIKCPSFVLLGLIENNEDISKIFDLSEIRNLEIDELYEWYLLRKEKNIFRNFNLVEGAFETYFNSNELLYFEFLDNIIENEYNAVNEVVSANSLLNFGEILSMVNTNGVVKKIYIYNEFDSDNIREDLHNLYGETFSFVHGDLQDVITENKIPAQSTFVFSDLSKVFDLHESGILNGSSILIADRYNYNYTDSGDPNVLLESLFQTDVFKLDFFNNITK